MLRYGRICYATGMNTQPTDQLTYMQGLHGIRNGVLQGLSDEDLAFNPGGNNVTLAELIDELQGIEKSYIESFKTGEYIEPIRNKIEGSSIGGYVATFKSLDDELTLKLKEHSSAAEVFKVVRPAGHVIPITQQVEIYLQAVFILMGKFVVYLKAMNKELPPSVEKYIG